MTCIVGIETGESVVIAGDCAGVSGLDVSARLDKKVFKLQKNLVVGYTSSFRFGQIVEYHYDLDVPENAQREWVVTQFIPHIRQILKEHGYANIHNNTERGGTMLVGVNSSLYCIYDDYQVAEYTRGYHSIGCGDCYALGAIYILKDEYDPVTVAEEALKAASFFSAGVLGPFHYAETN